MYIGRKYFPPNDQAVIDFINRYSFATLYGTLNGDPRAVHLPLEIQIDGDNAKLIGHVARGNDIKECFSQSESMMAVFMEPHAYISSSWYDFKEVPTWNYIAVHITGKPRGLSEQKTKESLYTLVDKYEGSNPNGFRMDQLDEKYLNAQVRGVVGFEIEISKIEARFKLSQNRDDKNYHVIISKLRDRDDALSHVIADEMEKIRKA